MGRLWLLVGRRLPDVPFGFLGPLIYLVGELFQKIFTLFHGVGFALLNIKGMISSSDLNVVHDGASIAI